MKSGLIIRHVPHEGIAGFREPIEAAGYVLDRIDVADPRFATLDLAEPDLLIMMGGPMGVYEHEQYPWIRCQQHRLAQRLALDRPTLGVCFGAQLMAAALGARVYPGPQKEIGVGPVELTEAGKLSCLAPLAGQPLLHWHGDTFDLPEHAVRLASTALYENQAFSLGRNILGLQFHPEVDSSRFERWLVGHSSELGAARIDVPELRSAVKHIGPALRIAGVSMLGHWLELVDFG